MVHSVNPVADADRLWEVASRPYRRATESAEALYRYSRHCLLYGVTSDEALVHIGSLVLVNAIDRLRHRGVAHPHVLLPYAVDHFRGRSRVVSDARIAAIAAAPSAYCRRYAEIPGAADKPRSARMLTGILNSSPSDTLQVAREYPGFLEAETLQEATPDGAIDMIVCADGTLFLGEGGWWVS